VNRLVTSLASNNDERPAVGLLAAWGRLPVLVAEAMQREGFRVCCLGVRHHAEDEALREAVDDFQWVGAARLGAAIRYFRRHGVKRATMAGKFHKADLYRPWGWFRYTPDATFLRTFYSHFVTHSSDRRDDTLLGAYVKAFAQGGIAMEPATDFSPDLLVPEGHVAGKPLTASQQADVRFGWRLAREMGRLDVGQSVCIKDRAAIAIEAIEGTDLCIERAGQLCRQGGFTVVKVAKPQQDMRFDVPTVGVKTLRTMRAAGASVLAIEADRTILLDGDDFRDFARRQGLSIVALSRQAVGELAA
jgi:DUF1009 family protein